MGHYGGDRGGDRGDRVAVWEIAARSASIFAVGVALLVGEGAVTNREYVTKIEATSRGGRVHQAKATRLPRSPRAVRRLRRDQVRSNCIRRIGTTESVARERSWTGTDRSRSCIANGKRVYNSWRIFRRISSLVA